MPAQAPQQLRQLRRGRIAGGDLDGPQFGPEPGFPVFHGARASAMVFRLHRGRGSDGLNRLPAA